MALYRHSLRCIRRILLPNKQITTITETRNIHRWVAPTLNELQRRRDKIGPDPETPRSSYLEWNYDAEIYSFGKRLNEDFNRKLLKQALTHRTYANLEEMEAEKEGCETQKLPDNTDMIHDGEQIISKYLKEHYSNKFPSIIVHAVHDHLMTTEMLAHVGLHIGLKDLVLSAKFPVDKTTLADTFKAIVSALKQSQNSERAQLFIRHFLVSQIHEKDVDDIWNPEHPYQYLQNLAKEKGMKEIEPRLCNQSAMNTILANYQVGIYSDKNLLGIGWGETIETAKNTAALDAIHKIYKLNINRL